MNKYTSKWWSCTNYTLVFQKGNRRETIFGLHCSPRWLVPEAEPGQRNSVGCCSSTLSNRQIPSTKERAGDDSRAIGRQVFTGDGHPRDSANWIQETNSAFAEVGRGLICQ